MNGNLTLITKFRLRFANDTSFDAPNFNIFTPYGVSKEAFSFHQSKRGCMKTLKTTWCTLLFLVVSPVWADKDAANKAIDQAEVLIESAERAGGMKHAVYLMKSARDNLNQAEVDLEEREWTDAEIAAKKSQRDAEVAAAKADAMKAEKAYADLRKSVDLLRNELQRKRSAQ